MKKTFVETREFTKRLQQFLDDASHASFQQALMQNPDLG
jgi:hypothetical protein